MIVFNSSLSSITQYSVLSLFGLSYIRSGSATILICGKLAILTANIAFSKAVETYIVLGSLPNGIKPHKSICFGLTPTTANDTASNYFELNANGELICYESPTGNSGFYNCAIPFFIK